MGDLPKAAQEQLTFLRLLPVVPWSVGWVRFPATQKSKRGGEGLYR